MRHKIPPFMRMQKQGLHNQLHAHLTWTPPWEGLCVGSDDNHDVHSTASEADCVRRWP